MAGEREAISMDALCKWITAELQKHEGCEECVVSGVYRLAEPDVEGCNWSPSTGTSIC